MPYSQPEGYLPLDEKNISQNNSKDAPVNSLITEVRENLSSNRASLYGKSRQNELRKSLSWVINPSEGNEESNTNSMKQSEETGCCNIM